MWYQKDENQYLPGTLESFDWATKKGVFINDADKSVRLFLFPLLSPFHLRFPFPLVVFFPLRFELKNQKSTVSEHLLYSRNPPMLEGTEDLTSLSYLVPLQLYFSFLSFILPSLFSLSSLMPLSDAPASTWGLAQSSISL